MQSRRSRCAAVTLHQPAGLSHDPGVQCGVSISPQDSPAPSDARVSVRQGCSFGSSGRDRLLTGFSSSCCACSGAG